MSSGSFAAKEAAYQQKVAHEEEDRRRIARELHDDIGQRLALLANDAVSLRNALKLTDESNRSRLDKLVQQVVDLGEDLRRISHTLHPAILEDLGLVPAIRSLIDDFMHRSATTVDFIAFNVPADLPLALSTALYRILQEALRNISKHAGPVPVEVTLQAAAGEIVLVISDSGVGFQTGRHAGLGITSMRERASALGGTLHIISAPGQGTSVQVHLPLAGSASQ
jgi:signal transduction histidine kinase